MQYIPCNSALLAQEALFLPKKALFMPKDLQKKVRKSRQNSICSGLKFSSESKLFGGGHPCSRATSATLSRIYLVSSSRQRLRIACMVATCFSTESHKNNTFSTVTSTCITFPGEAHTIKTNVWLGSTFQII